MTGDMDGRMSRTNRTGVFILFCLLILSAYANSFHAAWHFDDKPNILNNYAPAHPGPAAQNPCFDPLFQPKNPYEPARKMYRPVPCLTFALNWYVGQDDPFGFHVVNIALHILTAFFLYLLSRPSIQPRVCAGHLRQEKWLVPLLAAILWAVNPIHTQAVTYIVQRMAVMAGFFYLLGLYAFLKARLSNTARARLAGYGPVSCAIFWLSVPRRIRSSCPCR